MTLHYRELEPCRALRPYVVCYWILEGRNDGEAPPQPVFPDGHPELVLHYGDRFTQVDDGVSTAQPRAALVGQTERALHLAHGRVVGTVAARMRPSALALLTGIPAHELTARIVELRQVVGAAGDELHDSIGNASGDDARVRILERFLANRASRLDAPRGPVEAAVALARRRGGHVTVDALARHASLGARQLHRRFLARVGMSPKQYARIVRFQRALRQLEQGGSITDAALASGYYDHPHLSREFQSFSGMTPTRFLQTRSPLTKYFLDDVSDPYKPTASAP